MHCLVGQNFHYSTDCMIPLPHVSDILLLCLVSSKPNGMNTLDLEEI